MLAVIAICNSIAISSHTLNGRVGELMSGKVLLTRVVINIVISIGAIMFDNLNSIVTVSYPTCRYNEV